MCETMDLTTLIIVIYRISHHISLFESLFSQERGGWEGKMAMERLLVKSQNQLLAQETMQFLKPIQCVSQYRVTKSNINPKLHLPYPIFSNFDAAELKALCI